jgi:hypothetical protein
MQIVFWTWLVSASLTLGLFVAVSWIFDRMVVFSTWVKLALAVLVLAGPAGTVLTAILLFQTSLDTLRESGRQGHPPVVRKQAEA